MSDDYPAIARRLAEIQTAREAAISSGVCQQCTGAGWRSHSMYGAIVWLECASCGNPGKREKPTLPA